MYYGLGSAKSIILTEWKILKDLCTFAKDELSQTFNKFSWMF